MDLSNSFSLLSVNNEEDDSLLQLSKPSKSTPSLNEILNSIEIIRGDDIFRPALQKPLVWIDLEMTGLDIENDSILEVACIVTDGSLSRIIEGPDIAINLTEEALENMNDWCKVHHSASGLVEQVKNSKVTLAEAEQTVLTFVQKYSVSKVAQLAGNSVYVDYMFLKKHMPLLADHFSHVLVDVSSLKSVCQRWYPKVRCFPKVNAHRALDDIRESIAELQYFKRKCFK